MRSSLYEPCSWCGDDLYLPDAVTAGDMIQQRGVWHDNCAERVQELDRQFFESASVIRIGLAAVAVKLALDNISRIDEVDQ